MVPDSAVTPDRERAAVMDPDAVYRLTRRHIPAAAAAPPLKAVGIQDKRVNK